MRRVRIALIAYDIEDSWVERKWLSSRYVADFVVRKPVPPPAPPPLSKFEAEVLKRLCEIERLGRGRLVPGRFGRVIFLSERKSEMQIEIRKYRIAVAPADQSGIDKVVSRKLLVSLGDGLSPTLEDAGLPTSIDVAVDAESVEFETIDGRVTDLVLRDTDDDGNVGSNDPYSFTSVDNTGPSVAAFGLLVEIGERAVDLPDSPAPPSEPPADEPQAEPEAETPTDEPAPE